MHRCTHRIVRIVGSVMKLRRLIRWGYRYGVDVATEVGLNQSVSVQIFPELDDFSVANPEHMHPFIVEPSSGWPQAAGRMAQHSHEIWGSDNFSRRDGIESHMGGELKQNLTVIRLILKHPVATGAETALKPLPFSGRQSRMHFCVYLAITASSLDHGLCTAIIQKGLLELINKM